MPTSSRRPPPRSRSSYSIYPLEALDGVLVYVALNGETVGFCFGADERAAAEAVAAHVTHPVSRFRRDAAEPGPAGAHAATEPRAAGEQVAAREAWAGWASTEE